MKDFDELLDSVLQEDTAAQPRPGLEVRVLARVRTDGQRRPRWKFVAWGAIAAALPVCVVALLVWPRSVPPVQHVKEVPVMSGSTLPERVAAESVQNQPRKRVAEAGISVRPHRVRVTYQPESLPKLDVFPTPSVATGPERKLAEISRHYPGAIAPDAPEAAAERKLPAPLKIEPIEIAAIEITPLFPAKDTQAKEVQGR